MGGFVSLQDTREPGSQGSCPAADCRPAGRRSCQGSGLRRAFRSARLPKLACSGWTAPARSAAVSRAYRSLLDTQRVPRSGRLPASLPARLHMPRPRLRQSLRRLWALDKFSASLRVFIALAGALALCWWQGWVRGLIPLFLGIIASALTETDDSWQGRLGAVLVTLGCFSAAAYAVEFLFPYPWLFVVALALSAFCLTLLGALGERFATLGSGTLILA